MSISLWNKTDKGLKLQDVAELLKATQDAWADIFPNINLHPATPQGQLITVITDTLNNCQGQIIELANLVYSGGSGLQLDIRNKMMFGITRKPATPNYIDVEIVGRPRYILNKGLKISNSEDTLEFILKNDITIGENGKITASFYSDDNMEDIAIGLGQINTLKSKIEDEEAVESVKNTSYLFKAQPAENDTEFLKRAELSTQYRSDSIFSAGIAYILQVPGVVKVAARENVKELPESYKGATLPGHSITYVVEGGDNQEVAKAILKKKNPGCDMGGNVDIIIKDNITDQKYTIKFYRPTYKKIYVTMTILERLGDEKNYQDVVYEKMNAYLKNHPIGNDLLTVDVVNSIFDFNFIIQAFVVSDVNDGRFKQKIDAQFTTLFTINKEDVKIVLT